MLKNYHLISMLLFATSINSQFNKCHLFFKTRIYNRYVSPVSKSKLGERKLGKFCILGHRWLNSRILIKNPLKVYSAVCKK